MEDPRVKWLYLPITVILIALVLAAAFTGEESSGPVPEGRSPARPGQALVAIGDVTGTGFPHGTIDTITFRVGLASGGKSVVMENLSLIYADAVRTETLQPVVGLRGHPPPGAWGVIDVKNEEATPNNRLEYDEEFVIQINPKAPLVPGQFITIILDPPLGTPLTLRRVAPPTILGGDNILAAV